jgi:hypothetical protein
MNSWADLNLDPFSDHIDVLSKVLEVEPLEELRG